jgi:hypothetical protein
MIVSMTSNSLLTLRRSHSAGKYRRSCSFARVKLTDSHTARTFALRDSDGTVLAKVTKEFTSVARELLTDYNLYQIDLNPKEQK